MESQPQNPEFRINPENVRPCHWKLFMLPLNTMAYVKLAKSKL